MDFNFDSYFKKQQLIVERHQNLQKDLYQLREGLEQSEKKLMQNSQGIFGMNYSAYLKNLERAH
jgi:hypothetical protein